MSGGRRWNGCLDYGGFFSLFVLLKKIANDRALSDNLGQYHEELILKFGHLDPNQGGYVELGELHESLDDDLGMKRFPLYVCIHNYICGEN
jgi:calcium-dependent protein kinase